MPRITFNPNNDPNDPTDDYIGDNIGSGPDFIAGNAIPIPYDGYDNSNPDFLKLVVLLVVSVIILLIMTYMAGKKLFFA